MEAQVGNNVFSAQFNHGVKDKYYGLASYRVQNPAVQPQESAQPKSEIDEYKTSMFAKRRKRKKQIIWGSTIVVAASTFVLASIPLIFGKGRIPKAVSKFINRRIDKISDQIDSMKDKANMSQYESTYLGKLQKTQKGLEAAEGFMLNLTPLKDVLFERFLKKKLKMNKTCDKITGFFEKMAVKMVNVGYAKYAKELGNAKNVFTDANDYILKNKNPKEKVIINGVEKTVAEWVSVANSKMKKIHSDSEFFNDKNFDKRHRWLNKSLKNLPDEVYEKTYGDAKEFIKSPKRMTTFISEELAQPTKNTLGNFINTRKKQITNTPKDVAKELDVIVSEVRANLDLSDKKSIRIYKNLNELTSTYSSKSEFKTQEEKDSVKKEISTLISKVVELSKSEDISPERAKSIKKALGRYNHVIETDNKGELEELIDIYSALLPQEKITKVELSGLNLSRSLRVATEKESDKFVDKVRDLRVGSALTDVGTGILLPVATTGVAISMADTKEKKRSVALNYGVPLLAGIGASTYATIKMLSGGAALAFGVISSAIINDVCTRIDKHIKKSEKEKVIPQKINQQIKS